MEDIIKIGDKEVKLSNNVAWLMEYQEQFGKDATQEIIPLMASIIEAIGKGLKAYKNGQIDVEELADEIEGEAFQMLIPLYNANLSTMVINITWAMAKAADESIAPPKKWAKQFDSFHFDEIIPKLWEMNSKGFTTSKNLEGLRTLLGRAKETLNEIQKNKEAQPSDSTTSSSREQNEG